MRQTALAPVGPVSVIRAALPLWRRNALSTGGGVVLVALVGPPRMECRPWIHVSAQSGALRGRWNYSLKPRSQSLSIRLMAAQVQECWVCIRLISVGFHPARNPRYFPQTALQPWLVTDGSASLPSSGSGSNAWAEQTYKNVCAPSRGQIPSKFRVAFGKGGKQIAPPRL